MWAPQPGPQVEAIGATWCPELGFGGARGGGKSEFLLGDFLQDVPTYGKHWQGVLFRRTYPELQELIKRSFEMYAPTGAKWYEQAKEWHWPNGACLRMRYLEAVRDASRYQGHEYTWIGWDEKTQWSSLEAYFMLMACLRCSAADIPTKRVRCTANPGGAGHLAFKAYYIDPAPSYTPILDSETGAMRMFIPSLVTDNKILLERDPLYIERLKRVGSPELVRMWLEGDWSVTAGAYYPEFKPATHVIKPFPIPEHWVRFRSYDHGSAKPFACHWWAVASDGGPPEFRPDELICYREWYGASAPNVGLKLTIEQIATVINAKSLGEKYAYSVADPSIFIEDGGPSKAETFKRNGVIFRPADNSRHAGWEQFRSRLVGYDGRPTAFWFDTCKDSIRTIPAMQHDELKPEDLDSDLEDHAVDSIRYGFMSRPYNKLAPKGREPMRIMPTLNELWKAHDEFKRERDRI